ncbi:ADP-dependent NAD(P)H-hydrate dehydratase [Leucobacter komagatae]|uniref:ADP-dependent NAD(P)H-hydrate dehydratase n=1 Tax=Leucobacter komagatae TaxID=55969 RepID=UPI0005AC789B|nr:ADP/ATP-dependent (S)-NAD(P)H-hydrate dehydratase [Leucobacter komagatae]
MALPHTQAHAQKTWTATDAAAFLSPPEESDHKYSRGVLALRTGSTSYPGAAVLGAEAAWRTGLGLVQFVPQLGDSVSPHGLPTPAAAVIAARPETVVTAAPERADAWLIGSGTDPRSRTPAETAALTALLSGDAPVVVDAGALTLLASRAGGSTTHAPAIMTPHTGEFRALWEELKLRQPATAAAATIELARQLQTTVTLKGAVTLIASPEGLLLSAGPATPWLATAGTGDVLAGIMGALTATHAATVRTSPSLLAKLGATAAVLHDVAARIATRETAKGGSARPITAGDVARAIPAAVALVRSLTD